MIPTLRLGALVTAVSIFALSPLARAQSGDALGASVAIDNGLAVVGVPNDDSAGPDSGAVKVFSATTGVLYYVIPNPNPGVQTNFGSAVAISGTRIAVGVKGNTGRGGAYVYDLSSGTPTVPILTPQNPDGTFYSEFGCSVAISNNRVVVGAYGSYAGDGRAYVYDVNAANPVQPVMILQNPHPSTNDSFGCSVGISGTRIVVGAYLDDEGSVGDSGTAYVFDLGSTMPMNPIRTLGPPVRQANAHFGRSVAISGTIIVVGSPDHDTGASGAGTAYVHDLNSPLPMTVIENPSPDANDSFGSTVAISGSYMIIGAHLDDTGATDSGSAYVYDLTSANNTVPVTTLVNPAPALSDRFGIAVALSGQKVLVGADLDDTAATNAGSAYVYDLSGGTPNTPLVTLFGSGQQPGTLLAPASNTIIPSAVSIQFTLLESVTPGSVVLLFNDSSTIRILTLVSSQAAAGSHAFSFNPAAPAASAEIESGGAIADGVYSVALRFLDTRGKLVTTASRTNVRIDTTAPTLTHPFGRTAEATSANGTLVTYNASASDNGGSGVATFTATPPSGAFFAMGNTQVTLKAKDNAGHTTTASFVVTVGDTTAPFVATPLSPQSQAAGPTGTAALADYRSAAIALATDAVGVTGVTQSPPAGTVLGRGTHSLNFIFSDAAGNTTPMEITVTIDFERPSQPSTTLVQATFTDAPLGPPAGTKLSTFFAPAISDNRGLVARVAITSDRKKLGGIYREDGAGNSSLPAYQDGPTGISGINFKSFQDPLIAPGGEIAFVAKLQGDGVTRENDDSVWATAFDGTLQLALREGTPLTALGGVAIKSIRGTSLRDGELVALVKLKGAGVNKSNDTALLRQHSQDAITVLMRTSPHGSTGFPENSAPVFNAKTIGIFTPALGSPGHGRWHGANLVAKLTGTLDGTRNRSVITHFASNGDIQHIISSGQNQLPGAPPDIETGTFGLPAINPAGSDITLRGAFKIAAGGVTKLNDEVLAHFGPTGLTPTALEANPANSLTGPVWASFFDPVVNDAGHVAFLAKIRGDGVTTANRTGFWWGVPNAPELLVQLGGFAPDADGETTTAKWNAITSYALPSGAGAGPVFVAKADGRAGVWGVGSDGKLRELLRAGNSIEGKQVKSFTLLGAVPGAYGVARSYNATGSLALVATFVDKSQALLRLDLP